MPKYNRILFYLTIISILWITNDSILKIYYPGWITGKISDIIGILLTPLIITGLISLFFKKQNLKIIFWSSFLLSNFIFLFINLSQSNNNSFYKLIGSNETMNLADKSDLLFLPSSIFTISIFKHAKPFFRISIFRKFILLLFPTLALINTSYPRGRSDIQSILLLLTSANDLIIQLDPKEIQLTDNLYNFRFQFIGMNNESSPRSSEIQDQSSECPNPPNTPIELGNTENSYIESGKFQNYKIEISKSKNFESIEKTTDCNNTDCSIDLQGLNSGHYFWKVRIRYLYRNSCELKYENINVMQEIHYFTR